MAASFKDYVGLCMTNMLRCEFNMQRASANDRMQYIEDSKVNIENRMILIRFLNEHFGVSDLDQMRL